MNHIAKTDLLAIDIGGANLKLSNGMEYVTSVYFPLWKHPEKLVQAIGELLQQAPQTNQFVVTMTGELADCYRTKVEGVLHILESVSKACAQAKIEGLWIYGVDGTLHSLESALQRPMEIAAANWSASANVIALSFPDREGLFIDLGSTTCDLIPFSNGDLASQGKDDVTRAIHCELIYTGVKRSPVCSLCSTLALAEQQVPVAQELFATTIDAYLLLDKIPEDPAYLATADGRPATKEAAYDRLVRSICADRMSVTMEQAVEMAQCVEQEQKKLIETAVIKVLEGMENAEALVMISGAGEFLLREIIESLRVSSNLKPEIISLSDQFGNEASAAFPAYALANYARAKLSVEEAL